MLALLTLLACPDPVETDTDHPVLEVAPVVGVSVVPHQRVNTVLWVRWTQTLGVGSAWVEYAVDGEWSSTPPTPGWLGDHQQVILGLPERANVEVRVVNEASGTRLEAPGTRTASTGRVDSRIARPDVRVWNESQASPERYLLGSIDVTAKSWYDGPFWLFIMDREGEIVWYHEVPDSLCAMAPRVARDGTHVVFNASSIYSHFDQGERSRLTRLTLDLEQAETLLVPGNYLHFDETDEGTLLLDVYDKGTKDESLAERLTDGTTRTVWNCTADYGNRCSTNTVNWVPEKDTVLLSQYESASVFEVDRTSGEVLRSWGDRSDWAFVPPEHAFTWQHYPTLTAEGNLLVSTHLKSDESAQVVLEYALDDEAKTLTTVWSWGWDQDVWAKYSGEANRLANGNTLINYGTEGWIREVTPEGDVVWEVWFGDELLLGHNTLIDDLYALNEGW